jgi:hypothetical protein
MTVEIEILDTTVERDDFASKKTGVQYVKFSQKAALHKGQKYPELFELPRGMFERGKEQAPTPLPLGRYVLPPEAFRVGRFGGVELDDRVQPVPVDAAKLKVA